jgi:hypothetical protein
MLVVEITKFFTEYNLPQPPLPDNMLELGPCSILITETEGERRQRTGRVRITDAWDAVLYENEWIIDTGRQA